MKHHLPLVAAFLALVATACQTSPERTSTEALVRDAAAMIAAQGLEAFDELRTQDSRWLQGETYVFVSDLEGNILLQPADPRMEGTNLSDAQDASGRYFVREMLEMVSEQGEGWVDYDWPRPGTEELAKKSSFVMKTMLGTRAVAVGSGYYH